MYTSSQSCRPTVVRNALDFDRHTLGQLLDSDAAARGLVCKVLLENAVHLGEVGHVVEEDIDLGLGVSRADVPSCFVAVMQRTLTTRLMLTPASFRMATMFSQHCVVLSAMVPEISSPLLLAGICPETKTWGPATMAWLCGVV